MYNNYCYNNKYNNFNHKPYMAKNMLIKKAEISAQQQTIDETNSQEETGYIAIGVFTALGALPVENAVVTIYDIVGDGEEHIHAQLVTDANGRVPDVELPILHDNSEPLTSSKYYYAIYNLKAQADNYYTVNVLGIRIFPGIKTNYRIDMIPLMAGEEVPPPEQTFIIPPSPIEQTIE